LPDRFIRGDRFQLNRLIRKDKMTPAELEKLIKAARFYRHSSLNLSDKKLTNLPESFGNLTNLDDLLLSNNMLTILPESFRNLTNLSKLNLYSKRMFGNTESIE
jgi:hypothetical protein